jgi:O-6-methylguanine DNA methyltransferase
MGYVVVKSPIGLLTLVSGAQGLQEIRFGRLQPPGVALDASSNAPAVAQLNEYFAGRRREFDLRLDLRGTDFQRSVWRALLDIPYGETRSYGEVARAIGKPKAARAVGMANHENPVSIVVPCHRVIGHDGRLVGYGGGLDAKTALLKLEGSSTTSSTTPGVRKARQVPGRLQASDPRLVS